MSTRRTFLHAAGATVGGLLAGVRTARSEDRKPALRVAHITDVHITTDKDAPKGVAAMFAHMKSHPNWKADLVLNTGDAVMGIDGRVTGAKAGEQIALWKKAVQASPAPIRSCLGNHDVWGGTDPTADVPTDKAGFHLMTDVLGMPAPYYSFDQGGWHFVALNSVCNWPKYGSLTPEHFDWLKDDLKKMPTDTPVLVLSHLPIVSVTSTLYGDSCRKGNDNVVPGVWQHADCWAITEVFRRHPNVKLCLSGHITPATGANTAASGTSAAARSAAPGGPEPNTASHLSTADSTSSPTAPSIIGSSTTDGPQADGRASNSPGESSSTLTEPHPTTQCLMGWGFYLHYGSHFRGRESGGGRRDRCGRRFDAAGTRRAGFSREKHQIPRVGEIGRETRRVRGQEIHGRTPSAGGVHRGANRSL
jgi:hypothetical protein